MTLTFPRFAIGLTFLLALVFSVSAQTTKKSPKLVPLQKDADGTVWLTEFEDIYFTGSTFIAPVYAIDGTEGLGFILEMDCSDSTSRILRILHYSALTKKTETISEDLAWYRATGVTMKLMLVVCKSDPKKFSPHR